MKTSDFHYQLPPELIAHYPLAERRASRLLVLSGLGDIRHLGFSNLPELIRPNDLLVFNNTRVIPARLFGQKPTGGRVELLIERIRSPYIAAVHLRASKTPRPGSEILLDGGERVSLLDRDGDLFLLQSQRPWLEIAERDGHMPLPPYIDRPDELDDRERYQTLFAKKPGAVAAPTAGLHFDKALLAELDAAGVRRAELTLHVGAGTFQPVRVEEVTRHRMHSEWIQVSDDLVQQVRETKALGGRVVAIGTTALRALESAARNGDLTAFEGETDIFIYPGYRFRVVDALVTNFHLPESTLLMLVCAFSGQARIMQAYQTAIAQGYRFFSYGDAMFLEHSPDT